MHISEWKEIGEGFCLDVTGSYFNGLVSNIYEEACQYDLHECKDFCQKMGKICVGIEFHYSDRNQDGCVLLVRNGVSEEDAQKLVPNFCSYPPDQEFYHRTIGGVVESTGKIRDDDIACWSHHSNGNSIILVDSNF